MLALCVWGKLMIQKQIMKKLICILSLVAAHNISRISVKIKLVYKSNHIMGLCPIILCLLQFVTEAFIALVTFIFWISRISFYITEYHLQKALWRSSFPSSSAPHTPCSRANLVRLLWQDLNVSRDGNSSASLVHMPVFEHTHGRKKKKNPNI